MVNDEELDLLVRNYQQLTPTQQDVLREQVRERAKMLRAAMLLDLFRRLLFWLRRRSAAAHLSAWMTGCSKTLVFTAARSSRRCAAVPWSISNAGVFRAKTTVVPP
jgi:hypothetical protein